jgi:hypothetical protein
MVTVELTCDQADGIILADLKSVVRGILDDPWECHHNLDETSSCVDGFLKVIEYYTVSKEYEYFVETLDFKKLKTVSSSSDKVVGSAEIVNITEMEDGSAVVNFNVDVENQATLIGEGFKFLMIKAALGKTDDEIMKAFD